MNYLEVMIFIYFRQRLRFVCVFCIIGNQLYTHWGGLVMQDIKANNNFFYIEIHLFTFHGERQIFGLMFNPSIVIGYAKFNLYVLGL